MTTTEQAEQLRRIREKCEGAELGQEYSEDVGALLALLKDVEQLLTTITHSPEPAWNEWLFRRDALLEVIRTTPHAPHPHDDELIPSLTEIRLPVEPYPAALVVVLALVLVVGVAAVLVLVLVLWPST